MNDRLRAMNSVTPITAEAEALRAGGSSAIPILVGVGVVVGLVSLGSTFLHPEILQNAVAQASSGDSNTERLLQWVLRSGSGPAER
jgi:hypothetical protein